MSISNVNVKNWIINIKSYYLKKNTAAILLGILKINYFKGLKIIIREFIAGLLYIQQNEIILTQMQFATMCLSVKLYHNMRCWQLFKDSHIILNFNLVD